MASPRKPTKQPAKAKAGSNLVAVVAVIGLALMSYADLRSMNDIPIYVYFGMIGASLGAKWEDFADRFGGKR